MSNGSPVNSKGKFRKKWHPGDRLGPNKIRLLSYGSKDSHGNYAGVFQCPCCSSTYTARISRVSEGKGHQDCGCQENQRRKLVGEKNRKDITGQRFTRLVAIKPTNRKDRHGTGTYYWKCRCDCGNETYVPLSALRSGNTRSCGCLNKETSAKSGRGNVKNIIGQKFGLLTVVERDGSIKRGAKGIPVATWVCECDCGRRIKNVASVDLQSGNKKSCGCLSSMAEKEISDILQELSIPFESQKTFDSLVNPETNKLLRFDFFLENYNLVIEYDGKQHFFASSGWNSSDKFESLQKRDAIKNAWCLEHGVNIERIPYTTQITKELIESILAQYNNNS